MPFTVTLKLDPPCWDVGEPVLPLTAPNNARTTPYMPKGWMGAVLIIESRGNEYHVLETLSTIIFPCVGSRDEASETALSAAFAAGGLEKVKRLYRRGNEPAKNCWLRLPEWSLAYH